MDKLKELIKQLGTLLENIRDEKRNSNSIQDTIDPRGERAFKCIKKISRELDTYTVMTKKVDEVKSPLVNMCIEETTFNTANMLDTELEWYASKINRELERRRRKKIMNQERTVYKNNNPKNNILDGPFYDGETI